MDLRDFLDSILDFIGSESLTDEEFEDVTLPPTPAYDLATYEQLKLVLQSREDVSGQGKRLKLYFVAKGVDLSSAPPVHIAKSNIVFGGAI